MESREIIARSKSYKQTHFHVQLIDPVAGIQTGPRHSFEHDRIERFKLPHNAGKFWPGVPLSLRIHGIRAKARANGSFVSGALTSFAASKR
jgi:hypothetical protein